MLVNLLDDVSYCRDKGDSKRDLPQSRTRFERLLLGQLQELQRTQLIFEDYELRKLPMPFAGPLQDADHAGLFLLFMGQAPVLWWSELLIYLGIILLLLNFKKKDPWTMDAQLYDTSMFSWFQAFSNHGKVLSSSDGLAYDENSFGIGL